MNKNFKIGLIIQCVLLVSACEKMITWDEFALEKARYDGVELKIDGYYYRLTEDGRCTSLHCFYNNGVLLYLGGLYPTTTEADAYVRREFIADHRYREMRTRWGLFEISNQKIKFERYYNSDQLTKSAYIREGRILNDSTFHITVSYRSDGSERSGMNEYWYFHKFEKPDSTNVFFK